VRAARRERLERRAQVRDPGRHQSTHRGAVVRDLTRDHLVAAGLAVLLVEQARKLQRGLHRFAAAGREEHSIQIAGGQRRDLPRQRDRAGVGVAPDREECELLGLLGHRVGDLRTAVAGVDAEQRRETVEVALAVGVVDVAAFAARNHRHVVVLIRAEPGEVHPEIALGHLLQRTGGQFHLSPRLDAVDNRSPAVKQRQPSGGQDGCSAVIRNVQRGGARFEQLPLAVAPSAP
jgi:hypothetical protein